MVDKSISIEFMNDSTNKRLAKLKLDESIIDLPGKYVTYSMALREYEAQRFPNLFTLSPDEEVVHRGAKKVFRNQWTQINKRTDKWRILHKNKYEELLRSDPRILEAEEIRQQARKKFNSILSEGRIKSYIFDGKIGSFELLKASWWISLSRENIDYDSQLWHKTNDGYRFEAELILLDKKQLARELEENKNHYATKEQLDCYHEVVIRACIAEERVISRKLYNDYFIKLLYMCIKDEVLKLQMNNLPGRVVRPSGRPKKGSIKAITLSELQKYFEN